MGKPVIDFARKARWLPSSYNRGTAVAMEIIDQLSTYIYMFADNYQNGTYIKRIMKFIVP